LIEQYTITATPKYNFPQPTVDTTLPQRLIDLSLRSLKQVKNHNIQQNQQTIQQKLRLNTKLISLTPRRDETIVAAVDTSSIKIGETKTGMLIAVRGANVWKQNRHYRYVRLGPFIFHITEENKKEVYGILKNTYFNMPYQDSHRYSPTLMQMPTRIAALLERWLQNMLSKTIRNALILFDGSLTAGTPDTPAKQLKTILETARKRGNTVLAFSKMTSLRFNGHLITDTLFWHKPPYILEIILKPKPPMILMGDVYVAKLTKGNYAFRLDIDKEILTQQKIEAVEKLLGNDHFSQSYPETLRLAHILCTFTANEVIAMQHFITRKHKVKIINKPNMHRLLFGPFGKGEGNA
jgi:hypothetical protein